MEWDPGEAGSLRVVSEWSLSVEATHSERLLWSIHQTLEAARWRLEDVDVFAVGTGPGSFTSLRIGITTARTLAHTLGKPLVGVSSLAALVRPVALHFADRKERVIIVAATDACKGELFTLIGNSKTLTDCVIPPERSSEGIFQGLWKRGADEAVLTPPLLVQTVKKKLKEGSAESISRARWVALGEGRKRYADFWKEIPSGKRLELPVPFSDEVQGRYLGLLAWEAFQAGLARDPLKTHPRYLRASEAEVKLKKGLLKPAVTRGVANS